MMKKFLPLIIALMLLLMTCIQVVATDDADVIESSEGQAIELQDYDCDEAADDEAADCEEAAQAEDFVNSMIESEGEECAIPAEAKTAIEETDANSKVIKQVHIKCMHEEE